MCKECQPGKICPKRGMIEQEICPRGFVCKTINESAPDMLCPAGSWCDEGVSVDSWDHLEIDMKVFLNYSDYGLSK